MNIPFPIIYPSMVALDWFNSDKPCDEDAELTRLEQANQRWLNSIGKKYMKPLPIEKKNPPPVEEVETDDDVFIVTGNEDAEEEDAEEEDAEEEDAEEEDAEDDAEEDDAEDDDADEDDADDVDAEEEEEEEEDAEEELEESNDEEEMPAESPPVINEMEAEIPVDVIDIIDLEVEANAPQD